MDRGAKLVAMGNRIAFPVNFNGVGGAQTAVVERHKKGQEPPFTGQCRTEIIAGEGATAVLKCPPRPL